MLGAYKARVAPFNVNYRYVDDELVYLLSDAKARAIVYHAAFAPLLARIRARLPALELFIQVADDSHNDLLAGAVEYEQVLREGWPALVRDCSPDDLYIHMGGTGADPDRDTQAGGRRRLVDGRARTGAGSAHRG